jgi:hypothetical protein
MVELDIARERIEPLVEPLNEGHRRAVAKWAELLQEAPGLALPLDATARANFIHCHLRREVEAAVDGIEGVEVNDALDFFALRIEPNILLRFKYVGDGEPSNVPTERQKLLARQIYTEEMTLAVMGDASLAPPTLLTCGYTLDGDKLGRVEIRRDCKGHLPWSFDIYGGEALTEPIVMDGMADEARPATVTSKEETQEKQVGSEAG